MAKMKIALQ